MATTDDTSATGSGNPEQTLRELIEAPRAKVLQAHAVMICLREALLYADSADAVVYAEAASAAALIASDAADALDSVRLQPLLAVLAR